MKPHDVSTDRGSGLLGWLRLGQRATTPASSALPQSEQSGGPRLRQLNEIGAFLAYHQFEVTPATLTLAFNYLTGNDPRLVRLIDRRMQAREPVTLSWLDEAGGETGQGDELSNLIALIQRLESGIDEFGKTSHDAYRATSAYNSALEAQVIELEHVTKADVVISDLATIAKLMLQRTQDIEKQILRSEAQTRSLKQRLEATRREAEEDHLTGLPNRRAFESHFEREHCLARAASEALIVAFCDIDNFKQVNDRHGHDAGDRVLKLVAECLGRISDDRCHIARHGGEEFVVLFRDVPMDGAFSRLDKLRSQLAERSLVNRATDQPFGQITFSAGMADVFGYANRRIALKAADNALYRAKDEGRNRIIVAAAEDGGEQALAAA